MAVENYGETVALGSSDDLIVRVGRSGRTKDSFEIKETDLRNETHERKRNILATLFCDFGFFH